MGNVDISLLGVIFEGAILFVMTAFCFFVWRGAKRQAGQGDPVAKSRAFMTGDQILNLIYDSSTPAIKVNVAALSGGGLATSAKQDSQTALLTTIDADTSALVLKDYATQTTLAALNTKVTACNTGAVVVSSGSLTANAGTNLNTSALALETGGNLATIATNTASGVPQYGTDATGADAYATVVTASAAKKHIYIVLNGANPAIISLDGGTTDHFYIPGNSVATFDGVTILNAANVQAKNGTPGSNYTNLFITIW